MPVGEVALALGCLLDKVFGGFGRFWRAPGGFGGFWRVWRLWASAQVPPTPLYLGGAVGRERERDREGEGEGEMDGWMDG